MIAVIHPVNEVPLQLVTKWIAGTARDSGSIPPHAAVASDPAVEADT